MGKSHIRESIYQVDRVNNRYQIEEISMHELIMLNTCSVCLQGLKSMDATCTGITNGIPCITIPANRVDRYTLPRLEEMRMCREI